MEEKNNDDLKALISQTFSMEIPDGLDEEGLFQLLADGVAYMIEHKIDFLMSLLYRLDVLEPDINHALSPFCQDPANIALAKLIWERQKQRMATKQAYRERKDKDEDLGDYAF